LVVGPLRARPAAHGPEISTRRSLAQLHYRPLHADIFRLPALPCTGPAIISLDNNYCATYFAGFPNNAGYLGLTL